MTINRNEIAEALAKAEKAVKHLRAAERRLARFPAEPPVGAVLVFEKTFDNGSGPYTYAALHTRDDRWYFSGRETQPRTWDNVVEFIGDSPCRIASGWTVIPVVAGEEDSPADPEAIAELYGVSPGAFASTPRAEVDMAGPSMGYLMHHNHVPGPYPYVVDASAFVRDIPTATHTRDFEDGTNHYDDTSLARETADLVDSRDLPGH